MQRANCCKFIAKVWEVTDTLELIVKLLTVSTLYRYNQYLVVTRLTETKGRNSPDDTTHLERSYYRTTGVSDCKDGNVSNYESRNIMI